jgi:hypothetical protein
MQSDYLRVRKEDLPLPLIIEDKGQVAILSLEPAGKKKLGARLGSPRQSWSSPGHSSRTCVARPARR